MERFILNSIAIFILVLGGFINQSLAQAVDYSKVKVETLSNTQVLQLMTRAEEEGLSQDEQREASSSCKYNSISMIVNDITLLG